jgi:hypothetical protein
MQPGLEQLLDTSDFAYVSKLSDEEVRRMCREGEIEAGRGRT